MSRTITFTVWDAANNEPKTGDAANLTLSLILDGTASSPTNSPGESSVAGEYDLVLTTAEETSVRTAKSAKLAGASATTGVVVIPLPLSPVTVQGTKQTLDDLQDLSADQANAEVDQALSDYAPARPGDEMALSASQLSALVAAIEAEIADDATGEAVKQAIVDKLIENLPDLDELTLAAIAQAVWNRLTSALTAEGSIGKRIVDLVDVAVSTRSSHGPADVVTALQAVAEQFKATGFATAEAVTAVQAAVDLIHVVTDRLDGLVEDDGSGSDRFTQTALEQAPSGEVTGALDWTVEQKATILEQLAKLDSRIVQVRSMLDADENLTLVEGDDYLSGSVHGALSWTRQDYTGPDLDGLTATLRIMPREDYQGEGQTAVVETDVTLSQVGSTVTLTCQLAASALAALTVTTPPSPRHSYRYQVVVTTGEVTSTLKRGYLTLEKRIAPVAVS